VTLRQIWPVSHRVATSLLFFLGTVAGAAACRGRDAARLDSAVDTAAADTGAHGTDAGWVPEVGRLFVVPADSDDAGVILFPQIPTASLVGSLPITLISSSGTTTGARAALVESDSAVCGEAPTLRFVTPRSAPWTAGVAGTALTPVVTDSIEGMAAADSARLVATVSRLASSIPSPGSRFTALPFVVLSARTFDHAERRIVVAHLRRRLPQEATPLEEHVFLVAERPAPGNDQAYAVSYSQRSEGTEETADHYDALGVLISRQSLFLILARDRDERSTYEIIERTRTGVWLSRWARTLSC
jgi:hypothetical protein